MERTVQLVLGLALLVFFVHSGASETDSFRKLSQSDAPTDENIEELPLNDYDPYDKLEVDESEPVIIQDAPDVDELSEELASEDADPDNEQDSPTEDVDINNEELDADDAQGKGCFVSRHVIYRGYTYRLTAASTWTTARQICRKWGGDLASAGMRNFNHRREIMKLLKTSKNSWIGLNDLEVRGCFRWNDGKGCCATKTTAHWAKGEPNNYKKCNERCVELRRRYDWRSNDLKCSTKRPGVCEIPVHHVRRG